MGNSLRKLAVFIPTARMQEFFPVKQIRNCDKRGAYCFDPLQGMCDIVLVVKEGGVFEGEWHVEAECIEDPEHEMAQDATQARHEEDQDLYTWVHDVFSTGRRGGADFVLKGLKEAGVYTLEELMNMPEEYIKRMSPKLLEGSLPAITLGPRPKSSPLCVPRRNTASGNVNFILQQRKLLLAKLPSPKQEGFLVALPTHMLSKADS